MPRPSFSFRIPRMMVNGVKACWIRAECFNSTRIPTVSFHPSVIVMLDTCSSWSRFSSGPRYRIKPRVIGTRSFETCAISPGGFHTNERGKPAMEMDRFGTESPSPSRRLAGQVRTYSREPSVRADLAGCGTGERLTVPQRAQKEAARLRNDAGRMSVSLGDPTVSKVCPTDEPATPSAFYPHL